jgi:hypothetical protein
MIPKLEDLSISQRIVLTVIIVVAVLLLIGAVGFVSGRWEAKSEAVKHCIDDKTREDIRILTLEAVDTGFRQHIAHLFEVWVRDPAEQPKRAKVGLQSGITAYLRARSDALKWEPPSC